MIAKSSKYKVKTCPGGGWYSLVRKAVYMRASSEAMGRPIGIPLSPRWNKFIPFVV